MTKWYEPGRWLLVATLAAQLAGCAKTTQWARHVVGRDGPDSTTEVDGRDKLARNEKETDEEAVKVASGSDAQKKKSSRTAATTEREETAAATPKSKKPVQDKIARASKSEASPSDPFHEDTIERPNRGSSDSELAAEDVSPRKPKSAKLLDDEGPLVDLARSRRKALADEDESQVREVSHLERNKMPDADWTRDSRPGADKSSKTRDIPDDDTQLTADASVSRQLAELEPSRANYLQLCPQAEGEVRELVGELEADNLEQLMQGIHRLGKLGPDAAAALPALEQLLQHGDGHVRVHAALAVCRIDSVSPAALEALTAELKSDDPALRSFAAAVIAELGPQSGDAMPALVEAMHDTDPYVRLHVAEVLIRYEDHSTEALDALLVCLKHRDENLRWLAAYSLAELAPQSEDAVTALAKRLDDSSAKVQIGAVYALGEIGAMSRTAAAELRRLDHDANPEIRSAVAYALEQIESGENQDE